MSNLDVDIPAVATRRDELSGLLKDYLDDARLFADALEELQGQLASIENGIRSKGDIPTKSPALHQVLKQASTLRFKAYVQGSLPAPPQTDLAARIEENLQLLSVLCREMKRQVGRATELQESMKIELEKRGEASKAGELGEEGAGGEIDESKYDEADVATSRWWEDANRAFIAAAIVDGLRKELSLVEKVTQEVSVLTPSEDISSYVTIIRLQPFLSSPVVEEILRWQKAAPA